MMFITTLFKLQNFFNYLNIWKQRLGYINYRYMFSSHANHIFEACKGEEKNALKGMNIWPKFLNRS